MDFGSLVRGRLRELGLEQKDLASAAEVTESYISQLLTRRKAPPAPSRTDIYKKMEDFLDLPSGRLATLVDHERRDKLKKSFDDPPAPLHGEVRALVLRKCVSGREGDVRAIFEKEPFGALENLVTQKLLSAVKGAAKRELESESWVQRIANRTGRSYREMRVLVLEFLDADILTLSVENCDSFLEPLIDSWDIDLNSFAMEIVLNQRLASGYSKRFEFVEKELKDSVDEEPGFTAFLRDRLLSSDISDEEVRLLQRMNFKERRPTPLFYYRALQTLRDPLHFRED